MSKTQSERAAVAKAEADDLKRRTEQYTLNLATRLGPFLARGIRIENADPVTGAFELRCRSTGKTAGFCPTGDDMAYLEVGVDGESVQ